VPQFFELVESNPHCLDPNTLVAAPLRGSSAELRVRIYPDFQPSLWIHTMNRCRSTLIPFCFPCQRNAVMQLCALALCVAPFSVEAQGLVRNFPSKAERAVLQITQPPELLLNDQPGRMSPGVRIRGTNNMLVMSAQLIGQKVEVNLVRDLAGEVREVWILTQAEAALKLP
jgi:hypothetical protein